VFASTRTAAQVVLKILEEVVPGAAGFSTVRVLRVVRGIRPLRTVARMGLMKQVMDALVNSMQVRAGPGWRPALPSTSPGSSAACVVPAWE
jgi:hypothetical protein